MKLYKEKENENGGYDMYIAIAFIGANVSVVDTDDMAVDSIPTFKLKQYLASGVQVQGVRLGVSGEIVNEISKFPHFIVNENQALFKGNQIFPSASGLRRDRGETYTFSSCGRNFRMKFCGADNFCKVFKLGNGLLVRVSDATLSRMMEG